MNTEANIETNTETKRYQCRHIFTDGHRCGSPSLRRELFCYYHHTTRRPIADPHTRHARRAHFDLPLPEDRAAIQLSIGEVLRRIASNQIDPKRAGLLLYGLQIASLNLPRQPQAAPANRNQAAIVEEIIMDEHLGPLAPEAEVPPRPKTVVEALLEELNRKEDEPEDEQELNEEPTRYDPIENRFVPIEPPTTPAPEPTTLPKIQACAPTPQRCRSKDHAPQPQRQWHNRNQPAAQPRLRFQHKSRKDNAGML